MRPALARVGNGVLRGGRRPWDGMRSGTGGSRPTTSPGTLWSVFQLAQLPVRSWWQGSIPAPTERERQIFFVASALMVVLFVVALLSR
ncbi:MAG: hypothetical protein NT102_00725 [Caldiserica bacterium]|nr:hypothetical protein [Caldisericota bacterium]